MNENGNFIVCMSCWKKSSDKNPPVFGRLVESGNVHIKRQGLDFLISGEWFLITCQKCGVTLYEKLEKEEEVLFEDRKEKIKRFFFSGSILGGTI